MLGDGTYYTPEYWGSQQQLAVMASLRALIEAAPLFKPTMPRTGQPWSIWMTNLGDLGWVSDRNGYRYQDRHPISGQKWPAIPDILLQAWDDLTGYPAPPQCCLINYYDQAKSKMGLHQDRDEEAVDAPVLSFSLGDSAVFRMGGPQRKGPTQSLKLNSGDAFLFGGSARHYFHGIDRVLYGSSSLLSHTPDPDSPFTAGGRINLTLRRVTNP